MMDWSALQLVAMMIPGDAYNNPRVEEAVQFLQGPDFIPAENQPARLEFDDALHFRFPTPRPSACAENNVVYGRLYRCPGRWQERPAIILMPGSGDIASYKLRFPRIARRCNRAGLNVATLVPPYHFQRLPRQRGMFDVGDLFQLAENAAQAIGEIRALTGWLLGQGCPAVALWGYSLGAWYSGMTVCGDKRVAAAVLVAPPARMNAWTEQRALRPRIRSKFRRVCELCEPLNRTALNLTTTRPVIAKDKILLIEAIHDDAICPKADTEELWQAWGEPDIWRLPQGHVGVCCGFAPGLPERILGWLSPRLSGGLF